MTGLKLNRGKTIFVEIDLSFEKLLTHLVLNPY